MNTLRPYNFVFSFIGECCTRPHLYGITKTGRTKEEALRKALKEARKNGNEVYEVLEFVGALIGPVEEVNP